MHKFYFLSIIVLLIGCNGSNEGAETVQNTTSESDTSVVETVDVTSDGKTVEYHPNGNIKMEGKTNENGQREGLWIAYYENGNKWSESYYVDGLRDGHNLSFYPNGQLRYIGEYKDDKKVGTWKFYNEDGTLATEETY